MLAECLPSIAEDDVAVDFFESLKDEKDAFDMYSYKFKNRNHGLFIKSQHSVSSFINGFHGITDSKGVTLAPDNQPGIEYNPKVTVNSLAADVISKSETIKMWWSGVITEIDFEKDSVFATVVDVDGVHSRVEFTISTIVDSEEDVGLYIYQGSRFVYFVTRVKDYGTPSLTCKVEFIAPYVWSDSDNERAEKIANSLFPTDMLA